MLINVHLLVNELCEYQNVGFNDKIISFYIISTLKICGKKHHAFVTMVSKMVTRNNTSLASAVCADKGGLPNCGQFLKMLHTYRVLRCLRTLRDAARNKPTRDLFVLTTSDMTLKKYCHQWFYSLSTDYFALTDVTAGPETKNCKRYT